MTAADRTIDLSTAELRAVTAYALACAEPALSIFERDCPGDPRPRAALDEARRFAAGGRRTKELRVTALAAHRAARAAQELRRDAAADAARAAGHAAAAAYLHPLAQATQVRHILGSAAHAARARRLAGPVVVGVLARYPGAPPGGGRAGELLRELDAAVRRLATGR